MLIILKLLIYFITENKNDKNFDNWEKDALGCYQARKKFREILSCGLTNIVRIFKKPGEIFSYWDYQRGCWERNDGLLIDHFLISPKFLKFVKSINFESKYRGMQKPSDHIPIWISLNICVFALFFPLVCNSTNLPNQQFEGT